MTNGDEKNKNLKYFQGAIEKDIIMEKLKEWHVELEDNKCLQLELLLKL